MTKGDQAFPGTAGNTAGDRISLCFDFVSVPEHLQSFTTKIVIFIQPSVLGAVLPPAVNIAVDQTLYATNGNHNLTTYLNTVPRCSLNLKSILHRLLLRSKYPTTFPSERTAISCNGTMVYPMSKALGLR